MNDSGAYNHPDLGDVVIDETGIKNYSWPILPGTVNKLRNFLSRELLAVVRQLKRESNPRASYLEMCYMHIIFEVLRYIIPLLLLEKHKKEKYDYIFSRQHKLFQLLLNNEALPEFSILSRLKLGKSKPSRFFLILRKIKAIIYCKNIGYFFKKIILYKKYQNIYIYSKSTYIDDYVKNSKKDGINFLYRRVEDIFQNARPEIINNLPVHQEIHLVTDQVLERILKSFEVHGLMLDDGIQQHFRFNINKILHYIEFYYEYLSTCDLKLPSQVIMGTSSCIWRILLGAYYRSYGIPVVRLTHGSGSGVFKADGILNGSFFYGSNKCDEFIVYTQKRCSNIVETGSTDLTVDSLPQLKAFPLRKQYRKFARQHSKSSLNILYASAIFPVDRPSFFMRDYVYLDWVIRVIGKLKSFGHSVKYKPHPVEAAEFNSSSVVEKCYGKITLDDNFENVFYKYDLIIIDYLPTTIMVDLAYSDIPFIYIDLGLLPIDDDLISVLAKRASVVKANISEENRVMVDWSSVENAIDECKVLNDNTYLHEYYLGECAL